jgi:hypothetical protein
LTTKEVFISKLRDRDRLLNKLALVLGILLVALLFGVAGLDFAGIHGFLAWSGDVSVMKLFLILWMIAVVAVVIRVVIVNNGRHGVFCPHCKKRLQAISAQITVATGFCGFCGEQIFEQSFKKAE